MIITSTLVYEHRITLPFGMKFDESKLDKIKTKVFPPEESDSVTISSGCTTLRWKSVKINTSEGLSEADWYMILKSYIITY